MIIEAIAQTSGVSAGLGDACPIIPAACILKAGDKVINQVNPLKGLWDAFFGASPEETFASTMHMLFSVPRPDLSSGWFQMEYSNVIEFYGVIISVIVLVVMHLVVLTNHSTGLVLIWRDWFVSLLQMAFLPAFGAVMVYINYLLSQSLLSFADFKQPDNIVSLISPQYFGVGWMSLVIRFLSLFLLAEVVLFYLMLVVATLLGGLIIPFRGVGRFGQYWYTRLIKAIMLGALGVPIMMLVMGLSLYVINHIPAIGAVQYFQFWALNWAMFFAGYVPLKAFKMAGSTIDAASVRMAATYRPVKGEGSLKHEENMIRLEEYRDQRRLKSEERKNLVTDAAVLGAAIYTGGMSSAAAASYKMKTKHGNRAASGLRLMDNVVNRKREED